MTPPIICPKCGAINKVRIVTVGIFEEKMDDKYLSGSDIVDADERTLYCAVCHEELEDYDYNDVLDWWDGGPAPDPLIAAAPELLAALASLVAIADPISMSMHLSGSNEAVAEAYHLHRECEQARAVIAKAKGEN